MFAEFALMMGILEPLPEPEPIVNGTDASECQWPSVVHLHGSGCSASLITPDTVLTAAHCLDPEIAGPSDAIQFGESYSNPVGSIPIAECFQHPLYEITYDEEGFPRVLYDVAICKMTQTVSNIVPIPVIAGCEVDQLVPGADVTLVGIGASAGGNIDGQKWSEGHGTKRFTTVTVELVDDPEGDLQTIGENGNGVCYGDSGGPAMLQLDDGTWRIVGVASTTHPVESPGQCGSGAVHDLVHPYLDWLEEVAGVDITPCHDPDGTWDPGEGCEGFPTDPFDDSLTWTDGCMGQQVSGPGETCAAAGEESGEESGSGDAESGGESEESGGEAGDGDSGGTTSGGDAASDDGGSEETGGDGEASQTSDNGCGCSADPLGREAALWALGIVFVARRRRFR